MLAPLILLLALGASPVNVRPPSTKPAPAKPLDIIDAGRRDSDKPESFELPHAHVRAHSASEEEIRELERKERQDWNELCDTLINSTGTLRRIVILDQSLPASQAPFNFAKCKVHSPSARGSGHTLEIAFLNTMRKRNDEAGLLAVHRMLTESHDQHAPLAGVLAYLAVRSSERCFPDVVLAPLRSQAKKESPSGRALSEHIAAVDLLREVAKARRHHPKKSDLVALRIAVSEVVMDEQVWGVDHGAIRQATRVAAINRAAALLADCFTNSTGN